MSWLHFPQFSHHEFGLGVGGFLKDAVEHVNFNCIVTPLTFENFMSIQRKNKTLCNMDRLHKVWR